MSPLKIKFLARQPADQDIALWTSLLPNGDANSFGVEFLFDPDDRDYDYLVVYEGLTFRPGERKSNRVETLACGRANTLFITTEPPSIKVYGTHFLHQFGHVLTKQPINHPGHIDRTPPLRPYYGRPLPGEDGEYTPFDTLRQTYAERSGDKKHPELSTVCSDKTMTPALKARYDFVMRLAQDGEIDVFGRGIKPIANKAEAMDAYAYHIAIENHLAPGHWTEKISDCFLAECLPFYHGDPKIAEAFPEDAVIPINIHDFEASEAIITKTMRDREYERRLPAIREAKRHVIEDHNTLKVAADIVKETYDPEAPKGGNLMGRHAWRKAHPLLATRDAIARERVRRF